ncbi:hypothetical protein LUZ62_054526 [Rhynchospora pubera]|uniref:Retrotransposon Copia-like N-terminal domain-containing protein n=1 Tax=Rhynchospora pubera TaxID=906938 RepID=A0AAV8DR25_9POAL|nr:hypothetical protein LUZ62_054526 [Rhynchospora pubera]
MEFSAKGVVVPICLNGQNYTLWEFNLRCFIHGHELWGYIDYSEKKPILKPNAKAEDKEKYKASMKKWVSENSRIMSWILGSVEPHIGINLRAYQCAAEMWNYLKTIYHHDSDSRKYQLDVEIHAYTREQKIIQENYSGFISLARV